MIQSQTGKLPNKFRQSGVVVELKEYNLYAVKVDESGRLIVQNRKFLRKFNPVAYKSLDSIHYLRKPKIPQQKSVFFRL